MASRDREREESKAAGTPSGTRRHRGDSSARTVAARDEVGVTTFTTPSDRELVAIRVVEAPRSIVWEAWTNPEDVPHWLLGPEGWTMPVCEIDLRPGGAWRYVWHGPDGSTMEMRGVFREISPPERLVNTEEWVGGGWPETVNTVVLTEEDGKTTITCTVLYASKEAREAALGTGMKDGWSASYDRLDRYLPEMARASAPTPRGGGSTRPAR